MLCISMKAQQSIPIAMSFDEIQAASVECAEIKQVRKAIIDGI